MPILGRKKKSVRNKQEVVAKSQEGSRLKNLSRLRQEAMHEEFHTQHILIFSFLYTRQNYYASASSKALGTILKGVLKSKKKKKGGGGKGPHPLTSKHFTSFFFKQGKNKYIDSGSHNQMFLAKILERIASSQLRAYLDEYKLLPEMQSAYRQFHSTETALIKVLKWLKTFSTIPWGVPQGSVMGPLEYILYTGPLCEIISAHPDIQYAVYADDTQLYITMSPNKHNESLQKLSQCISDIMAWSSSNKLKLNQSKTEILHITSQFRNSGDLPSLDVAGVDVISSKNVRDLGVIIDNKLNMQQHIRKTCRAAAFGISKIGKIRRF